MKMYYVLIVVILALSSLAWASFFLYPSSNDDDIKTEITTGVVEEVTNTDKNIDNMPAVVVDTNQQIITGEQTSQTEKDFQIDEVLTRAIHVTTPMVGETRKEALLKLANVTEALRNDNNYFDGWMELGVIRKLIGDYEGAALAWEVAGFVNPNIFVSFSNLGDLYHHNIKNEILAEEYYRKAIDVQPQSPTVYIQLHELYRYNLPSKVDLADEVLLEGIEANPEDINLLTTLAGYYQEKGELKKALEYFKKAHTLFLMFNMDSTLIEETIKNLEDEINK
jgi:tetratricopeptide (TPR) repeat protein